MSDLDVGELLIAVRPAARGWMLERPFVEPLVFNSGAQAERAARLYAEGLARAGLRVVLEIVLRDGRLGARLSFPPQGAAGADARERCEAA
jgi:hypothetical protein